MLCERWGISKEEWAFIDSKIKDVTGTETEAEIEDFDE